MLLKFFILLSLLFPSIPEETVSPTDSSTAVKSTKGEWKGHLDFSSGAGFMRRLKKAPLSWRTTNQMKLEVGYTKPKFQFSTTLSGGYDTRKAEKVRTMMKDTVSIGLDYQTLDTLRPSQRWTTLLRWTPSERNSYTVNASYGMTHQKIDNDYTNIGMSTESFAVDYFDQVEKTNVHIASLSYSSSHTLENPRHTFLFSVEDRFSSDAKYATWLETKSKTGPDDITPIRNLEPNGGYILYPIKRIQEFRSSAMYRLKEPLGLKGTSFETGIRYTSRWTRERNSGERMVSPGVWVDSTSLRENFNYFEFILEPRIMLSYKGKKIEAGLDHYLQFYAGQLTNESHFQHPKWRKPVLTGRTFFTWTPSNKHSFTLGNNLSVTHPTYQQLCWYTRPGSSASQLIRGNPDLGSVYSLSFDLAYKLNVGKFSSETVATVRHTENGIEQTFKDENIGGRSYHVFSWENLAYGNSFNWRVNTRWNGKWLIPTFSAVYNQDRRIIYRSEKTLFNNHNWTFTGGLTAKMGKGWSASATAHYEGAYATVYFRNGRDFILNLRAEKAFKKVTVYLEGRDILDRMEEHSFTSNDFTDVWREAIYFNRRLFRVGVSWNFLQPKK